MTINCSSAFRQRILGRESFGDLMNGGAIRVFSGAQPASADQPEQGTLLGVVSVNGQPWTAGASGWGLHFDPLGPYMMQRATETWLLSCIANGTAGWFRIVANPPDNGQGSLTALRIDGAIGTPAAPSDMTWGNPAIVAGNSYPITNLFFAIPPAH